MERPSLPDDARGALEVWTADDGLGSRFHVADGESAREISDLLAAAVAETLAGQRSYDLDAHVWLAQFVVRDNQVGCGYGTLDADGSLLRNTLRDLAVHAAAVLEHAADRHAIESRLAVVEAMGHALDRWDLLSALVLASADREDAGRRLAGAPFHFSALQTEHVLDLSLSRRTRLGRDSLRDEQASLQAALAALPDPSATAS